MVITIITHAGLIQFYWRQHKVIAVILAYFRVKYHRLHVGESQYNLLLEVIMHLHAVNNYIYFMSINRMTWLKIKELGLQRRGPLVQYSPLPRVQAAIEVCY